MKIIGEGNVQIYDAIDECPHEPDSDVQWQESVALLVWDPKQNVYIFLRMSHEPNRGVGFSTVWLAAWTPEHTYRRHDTSIALIAGNRSEKSYSAGDGLCRYEFIGDGQHRFTIKDHINDQDVNISLVFKDSHPGIGYFAAGSASLVSEMCKGHLEATGLVTGSIAIKGKSYTIDGTGWRDHSWGKRNWQGLLAHRALYGIFGGEFNFFALSLIAGDGSKTKIGLVIRGDTIQATKDFDIVAYMGEDGVSNLGGKVTLRLDGKTHVLEVKPVGKAAISYHLGCTVVDNLCTATMGDRIGVGFMETSNRAQNGTDRPHVFPDSPGIIDSGIYPR